MVCPKCGQNNPESARICTNCNYKFYFGHAYHDPKFMMFPARVKASRFLSYLFLGILVLIFALQIWKWLR